MTETIEKPKIRQQHCINKGCGGQLGTDIGKFADSKIKIRGIYRIVENFVCMKCRQSWQTTGAVITKEECRQWQSEEDKKREKRLAEQDKQKMKAKNITLPEKNATKPPKASTAVVGPIKIVSRKTSKST